MDVGRYYRNAAILPLVLTGAGYVLATSIPDASPNRLLSWLQGAGAFFIITGIFALVPYALFLAIAWRFFKPESAAAHRRLALLAPLCIAASVGSAVAFAGMFEIGWDGVKGVPVMFGLFGAWSLIVGYVHASIVIAVAESTAAFVRCRDGRSA